MSVVTGVLFHAVGAGSASVCYTPQEKTKAWSWQTYWLAQALFCWFLLPIFIAWITIPQIGSVLSEAPRDAMLQAFILGAAYGIGGTSFGLAIRYIGFSLTYAISIGLSCVIGTLVPPIIHGQLSGILNQLGAGWLMSGIAIGALGIVICGFAGRFKEKDLGSKGDSTTKFSLSKGLSLSLLAGILSAFYGIALAQGQSIADVAVKYGAGQFQGNIIYVFTNTGAFLTTAIYCIYLHIKQKTFGEYKTLKSSERRAALPINYVLAFVTGLLWYGQFFFYGLGSVRMGPYQFSSWAIHMIMLVLFSMVIGVILKEWMGVKLRTKWSLATAVIVLIAAVLVLSYGNYLGTLTIN